MQERRLLQYIDKDDIPSSAQLVTSEAQTGTVLYLPIVEYHGISSDNIVYLYGADGKGSSEVELSLGISASSNNAYSNYQSRWYSTSDSIYHQNRTVYICPIFPKNGAADGPLKYPTDFLPQPWCIGKYTKLVFNNPILLSNFQYNGNNISKQEQYFGTRSVNGYGAYIDNE